MEYIWRKNLCGICFINKDINQELLGLTSVKPWRVSEFNANQRRIATTDCTTGDEWDGPKSWGWLDLFRWGRLEHVLDSEIAIVDCLVGVD